MSNWQPLESNCEVINKYLSEIGLDTSTFLFQDLLSIEDWAQEMIAKPVLGLLFIYEITDKQEEFRHKEEAALAQDGQQVPADLFYMKQFAQNACGTVGVFHILGNLPPAHQALLKPASLLSNFYAKVQGKTAEEAGKIFENNDELKEKHVSAAEEGHTNVNEHQETCNHFIAIVQSGGFVFELDGRKKRPVNHGPTSAETFLADACAVAKSFMDREPENVNAGLIVLAPAPLE